MVLLAIFFVRVDLHEVVADLRGIDLRWAVLGMVAMSASRVVQVCRWRLLLRRWERLPLLRLGAIYLVGSLASALLPLRAGDALRVRLADRRLHVPPAELAATVFVVETLLDWAASVVMITIALTLFLDVPAFARSLFTVFVVVALGALVGGTLLAAMDRPSDPTARRPIKWLPARARPLAARLLRQFIQGLDVLRQPVLAAMALVLSAIIWLLEVAIYWSMAQAFGLGLSFADCFLVMIAANVVLAIPLTPWQIGTFEVGVTGVLVLLGVPRDAAAGFALGAHALLMVWLSLLGLIALWGLKLEPADLLGAAEARADRPAQPNGLSS